MNQNSKAAPHGAISPALLKRYRTLLVPYRPPYLPTSYHVLRWGAWVHQAWPGKKPKSLDDYALNRHLGSIDHVVSVRWSLAESYRFAVIDLDSSLKGVPVAKQAENPSWVASADEEMGWKLRFTLEALGFPPHVVFRSSASRGLHLYLFLDRAYPAREIHDTLIERLAAGGLAPGDGTVDKVFPSEQALRLPLGPGSCLLDDSDLVAWAKRPQPKPIRVSGNLVTYAEEWPGNPPPLRSVATVLQHWVRSELEAYVEDNFGHGEIPPFVHEVADLDASVVELARRAANTVSLDALRARGVLGKGAGQGATRGQGAGTAVAVATAVPRSTPCTVASLLQQPAEARRRHEQRTALVCAMYWSGMDKPTAAREFEGWLKLSASHGTSKDLRGADRATIAANLKDALRFWDFLVEKHGPAPRCPKLGAQRPPFVALSVIAGVVPRSHARTLAPPSLTSTPQSGWNRDAAKAAVGRQDVALLASIPSGWVVERATVLVGLLRMAEMQSGALSHVTICSKVLDRVMGGHGAPEDVVKGFTCPLTGRPPSGREIVQSELARLGYLRRLDDGIKGKRGSLFVVTLPQP